MMRRTLLMLVVIFSSATSWSGTPDHLTWVAKKQDALILGEVLNTSSGVTEVKVLAIFPQTKITTLATGETIRLETIFQSDLVKNGNKYLISLNKIGRSSGLSFKVAGDMIALTPNSSNFRNARLMNPAQVDYQYMITTGGRSPLPLYTYPLEPDASLGGPKIPPDLLAQLSTQELIEHWINYPRFLDLYAFNTLQQGFDRLRTRFNGLSELFNRPDTPIVLLTILKEKDLSVFEQPLIDTEKMFFEQEQVTLSMLMAQPEILANLYEQLREELIEEVEKRLQKIRGLPALNRSNVKISYELLQQRLKTAAKE